MKYIIMDCYNTCHAVKYTLPMLSHEERGTGVVFGFINRVLSVAQEFKCRDFIFAWESPGRETLKRKVLYPGYKEKGGERTPEEEELNNIAFPQFRELLFNALPDLGFKGQHWVPGYEADDVIAQVVKDNPRDEFIIVSRDEDLYQLLRPGVVVYDAKERKSFSHADFLKRYGISPDRWVDVKSLTGCSGDGVPGIQGIGEGKALQYVRKEMPVHHKAWSKIRDAEKAGRVDFTRKLVQLPFDDKIPSMVLRNREDFFSMKDFIRVCERYGFRSFLTGSRFDLWRSLFVKGRLE